MASPNYQYSNSYVDALHTGNLQIVGFPNKPLFANNSYVTPVNIVNGQVLLQTPSGPTGGNIVGAGGINVSLSGSTYTISGNTSQLSGQLLLTNLTSTNFTDQNYPDSVYAVGNVNTSYIGTFFPILGRNYSIYVKATGNISGDAVFVKSEYLVRLPNIIKVSSSTASTNPIYQLSTINLVNNSGNVDFVATNSGNWNMNVTVISV